MSIFNKSIFSKVVIMAVLVVAVTACSSPEKDAEVREEPAMPIDAQQRVTQDAAQTDPAAATGITMDAEHPMTDTTADAAHSTTMPKTATPKTATPETATPDTATADASMAAGADTMATPDAGAMGTDQTGTTDKAAVADGTDTEENVSTY